MRCGDKWRVELDGHLECGQLLDLLSLSLALCRKIGRSFFHERPNWLREALLSTPNFVYRLVVTVSILFSNKRNTTLTRLLIFVLFFRFCFLRNLRSVIGCNIYLSQFFFGTIIDIFVLYYYYFSETFGV